MAPGIPIRFISDAVRSTLHPALFTPCEWRDATGQMFVLTGALQIHAAFRVESNEPDGAKPGRRRLHGAAGDWVLRSDDDRCAVVGNKQFAGLVRRVNRRVPKHMPDGG